MVAAFLQFNLWDSGGIRSSEFGFDEGLLLGSDTSHKLYIFVCVLSFVLSQNGF